MSNLWLNIRFGAWHVQIEKGSLIPHWSRNSYHEGRPFQIKIYELRLPF